MEKTDKKIIKPIEIKLAEYHYLTWFVKPSPDCIPEDLLDPSYWAHVSMNFKAGHMIIAVPDDRHFFAEYIVMAASTNWAKVKLLRKVDLFDNSKTEVSGFTVEWAGPHDKWRVKNGNDIISKGHDDKESASQALQEHLRVIK